MKQLISLVSVLLIFSACGSPGEAGGSSDSYEGAWSLVSGKGPGGEVPMVPNYPITMDIKGADLNGTAACNHYGGPVTIEGSSFATDGFAVTEMGCDLKVSKSEQTYLDAIAAADTIARDDAKLVLTGPETRLVYEEVPPVPTAELEDTTWHLDSLLQGRGSDGIASSAAPATLELRNDGTIKGSTGCRELHGEWYEQGNEIRFSTFGAEGDCPAELRSQDDHVVGVLGDGFTVAIEGNQLTVYAARGDNGLIYRTD